MGLHDALPICGPVRDGIQDLGKNVDALKGKTTRRKPEVVKGTLSECSHFFGEQDTVLSHSIEGNNVYCSPPSCEPHGSADT